MTELPPIFDADSLLGGSTLSKGGYWLERPCSRCFRESSLPVPGGLGRIDSIAIGAWVRHIEAVRSSPACLIGDDTSGSSRLPATLSQLTPAHRAFRRRVLRESAGSDDLHGAPGAGGPVGVPQRTQFMLLLPNVVLRTSLAAGCLGQVVQLVIAAPTSNFVPNGSVMFATRP